MQACRNLLKQLENIMINLQNKTERNENENKILEKMPSLILSADEIYENLKDTEIYESVIDDSESDMNDFLKRKDSMVYYFSDNDY